MLLSLKASLSFESEFCHGCLVLFKGIVMELVGVLVVISVGSLITIVVLARKLGSSNARRAKAEMDISLYKDFLEKTNEELPNHLDDIRKLLLER